MPWLLLDVVDSIVQFDTLKSCILLQSEFNSKAQQMEIQRSLIRKLSFYEFKPEPNAMKKHKYLLCRM